MYKIVFLFLLASSAQVISAQKLTVTSSVINFGDDIAWKENQFDDSNWNSIRLQSPWEDQGYYDKDGYAWYRIHFDADNIEEDAWYDLSVGRIDDADISYLNGNEIGRTGSFPPNYVTAYHQFRNYVIQGKSLLKRDNLLAIKIYDERLFGGWLEGKFAIKKVDYSANMIALLSPLWRFKLGDNLKWSTSTFNDSSWTLIRSGESWENQGFKNRDGFAWYRTQVLLPENISQTDLILDLGYIDDADQVFINGELIGETGTFLEDRVEYDDFNYQKERLYKVPKRFIKSEEELIIAIRVFDGLNDGGLYKGIPKIRYPEPSISFWEQFKELIKRSLFD